MGVNNLTMPKIIDLLQELPEDIRERALRNWDRKFNEADDLRDAIKIMFYWGETPEGSEYWFYVANCDYSEARALLSPQIKTCPHCGMEI
jgi:hypothetical protein